VASLRLLELPSRCPPGCPTTALSSPSRGVTPQLVHPSVEIAARASIPPVHVPQPKIPPTSIHCKFGGSENSDKRRGSGLTILTCVCRESGGRRSFRSLGAAALSVVDLASESWEPILCASTDLWGNRPKTVRAGFRSPIINTHSRFATELRKYD
jgi:hypothetical protein